MPATYPAGEAFPQGIPVHIADDHIVFNDKIGFSEGSIAHGGISIQPDPDGVNRLTVTFFVGKIDIDDSALHKVDVRARS